MPTRMKWGLILGRNSAIKAGKARMESMSQEEKSEFQSMAAKARWKKNKQEIEKNKLIPGYVYSEKQKDK